MIRSLLLLLIGVAPALAASQPSSATSGGPSPFTWFCKGAQWCDRIVAVVDTEPILLSEVVGELQIQATRSRTPMPTDSAGLAVALREVLDAIIDAKVLIQAARKAEIEVDEAEIRAGMDAQMQSIRRQFPNDSALRLALRGAGFSSIEAFRAQTMQQMRDSVLQTEYLKKLRTEGKMPPVQVTEEEITKAYEENKHRLPPQLGGYTFKQIVIPIRPSPAAKLAARTKADSLRVLIVGGADFEELAKKESMDPSSRELGGALPEFRKGEGLAPEFERWLFRLLPTQISPVFETQFGYHIVRVDRVEPGSVKSHHILIRPKTDSADLVTTRALADSVATALRAGASFDSLANLYHTPDELRSFPSPIPLDTMYTEYATAMRDLKPNEVSAPFELAGRDSQPTFRVVVVTKIVQPRENTVEDWRVFFREEISRRKQMRTLVDRLRKQTYIDIRL